MSTVLITGARAPVAVDLARSFAAAGYAVHLADSVTGWAARLSSAVTATHRLPPPRTDFQGFAAALRALVAALDPVAIIPTCEEVFYVAAAGLDDRALVPPPGVLGTLHSKIAFAAHARAIGVTTPETWRITSRAELDAAPVEPDDLVLKPEFSRFATHSLIRPTRAQVDAIDFVPTIPWAAQRFVAGEELCLWSFARSGRLVASVVYRPIWRHGRAAAYAFERVACPAAIEIARAMAAADHLTGHLSFDLIVTPDGTPVPIECNPRAVSGLHLFDAQPDLARAMLGDGDAHACDGLRYLGPAMLLLGLPAAIAAKRMGDLARDIGRGRDVIGRSGDRFPILGAMLDATGFAAHALMARQAAAGATTADIEWNGEAIG
ncbi:ATP-grasp domain-containing protein [Sphingosinithalassobacter portus]|uniref:ATP-grasp domain-containing protein n=1 Tax=Stakelama portus TaxID=2676234 RepID=UPI000D6E66AF|nr:ATP-grasp domain-containing protein [Sphingosinithalassobacter portus]